MVVLISQAFIFVLVFVATPLTGGRLPHPSTGGRVEPAWSSQASRRRTPQDSSLRDTRSMMYHLERYNKQQVVFKFNPTINPNIFSATWEPLLSQNKKSKSVTTRSLKKGDELFSYSQPWDWNKNTTNTPWFVQLQLNNQIDEFLVLLVAENLK